MGHGDYGFCDWTPDNLWWEESDGADQLAQIYLKQIVRLHGVPVSIVSDRDTKFTSAFWGAFQKALETKVHTSTTYHPQTNG